MERVDRALDDLRLRRAIDMHQRRIPVAPVRVNVSDGQRAFEAAAHGQVGVMAGGKGGAPRARRVDLVPFCAGPGKTSVNCLVMHRAAIDLDPGQPLELYRGEYLVVVEHDRNGVVVAGTYSENEHLWSVRAPRTRRGNHYLRSPPRASGVTCRRLIAAARDLYRDAATGGGRWMARLTLAQAEIIVDAALAKGAELELNPLTIAILDDGAHLKMFKRQDGPGAPMRPKIAIGKAFAAVGLGIGTRPWEERAKERPLLIQGFMGLVDEFIAVPGGVVIRDGEGEILGAVGVSGDTSDADEQCAVAGIQAAGLIADTGG